MVRRLLATRRDVFPDYTLDGFRAAAADALRDRRRESRHRGQPAHALPAPSALTRRLAGASGSAQAGQPVGDVDELVRLPSAA